MRKIKFRGKAIISIDELELMGIEHDSGWVYGNLIKNGNRPMITADILEEIEESIYPEWWVVVDPKTVGQYTGLKDKNGREIYEGDIAKSRKRLFVARWNNDIASFVWEPLDGENSHPCFNVGTVKNMEIVGNIFEYPHLLGGEEE